MELINYWAILAAGVSSVVLGMIWYGPLFGKYWMRLNGFTYESMKMMGLPMWLAAGLGFVSALVGAYVLYLTLGAFAAWEIGDVLTTVFWLWLGFVATTVLAPVLWEGKDWRIFVLNSAHLLVAMALQATIMFYFPWF